MQFLEVKYDHRNDSTGEMRVSSTSVFLHHICHRVKMQSDEKPYPMSTIGFVAASGYSNSPRVGDEGENEWGQKQRPLEVDCRFGGDSQ